MCVYVYVCVCMCVCMRVFVCVCVCVCVCDILRYWGPPHRILAYAFYLEVLIFCVLRFKISGFIIINFIHFELIFVHDKSIRSSFILLYVEIQFFQTYIE